MTVLLRLVLVAFALAAPGAALAQELAPVPVPARLEGRSALVCAKIDAEGRVDAFVLDSTGDAARDEAVVAWVRQLHWPKAKRRDGGRDSWFPMPLAFGNAPPPPMPDSCAPPADRK